MEKRSLFIPVVIVLGLLFVALAYYGAYHSWLTAVPPEADIAMHRKWANIFLSIALADLLAIVVVVVFRRKLGL
jgi:hypothetical protein